jgi:hypothetical protein
MYAKESKSWDSRHAGRLQGMVNKGFFLTKSDFPVHRKGSDSEMGQTGRLLVF